MVHIVHMVHAPGCNNDQAIRPRPGDNGRAPASKKRPGIVAAPGSSQKISALDNVPRARLLTRPLTLIL